MAEREGTIERDGVRLAYALLDGRDPVVVFLPGFASDMTGTKASFLRDLCEKRGQAMLRLDYAGHGASGGRFEEGTIGSWTADAEAVIEATVPGRRLLLVGSSMGGWVALLLGIAVAPRLAGLIGIAAAPDFTEDLIKSSLDDAQRAVLARGEMLDLPNPYGDPTPISPALLEDGAKHLLLRGEIAIAAPVRLLHGQRDEEVPWRTSLAIAERVMADDVEITLVKDGDHRLSREQDLARLAACVGELAGWADGGR